MSELQANQITIPKSHFEKGEYVKYQGKTQAIERCLYDPNEQKWLYQFVDHADLADCSQLVSTGIAWK
jgi:hypothetical protein